MRNTPLFLLFILSIFSTTLFAQYGAGTKSHIGIAIGVMNYSGFMNNKSITLSQAKPAFEGMYQYDITNNFHVRATATVGSLGRDNGSDYIQNSTSRSGSFKTGIFDIDILPEYTFLDLTHHRVSPYVYAGGGYYTLFSYQKDGVSYNKPNNNGFNFRGGLGVKYAATPNIQLFLEGDRREFSKSIDFYESKNSPSRYYSLMIGASFRLQSIKPKELW